MRKGRVMLAQKLPLLYSENDSGYFMVVEPFKE
jgi:hypothetical protein